MGFDWCTLWLAGWPYSCAVFSTTDHVLQLLPGSMTWFGLSRESSQTCCMQGDMIASMASICLSDIRVCIYAYDIYVIWYVHRCALAQGKWPVIIAHFVFIWQFVCRLSVLIFQPDPKQKTIYDLFQRTFSECGDDTDELLLLEAADACCEVDSGSALQDTGGETCSVSSPKKRRIEEFFNA